MSERCAHTLSSLSGISSMWHSTPSVLTAMSFKLFAMETTLHRLRAVSKNPHRSLQSAARKGQNFEHFILKYLLNFVVKKINQLTTIFTSFAPALSVWNVCIYTVLTTRTPPGGWGCRKKSRKTGILTPILKTFCFFIYTYIGSPFIENREKF